MTLNCVFIHLFLNYINMNLDDSRFEERKELVETRETIETYAAAAVA